MSNIKYISYPEEDFKPIPIDLKQAIVEEKLLIKSNKTTFSSIRKFIASGNRKTWELNYSSRMDKMSVPTSPVSAYLKEAFGENWKDVIVYSKKTKAYRNGETRSIKYSIEDIWHLAFNFEDEEYYREFLTKNLGLDELVVDQLVKLWNNIPDGYGNLSLKAINNILPFLKEGIIYSEAVLLAKIPELIGEERFAEDKNLILEQLHKEIEINRKLKSIVDIANALIADYKVLSWEHKFAHKDTSYLLDEIDKRNVLKACEDHFGEQRWGNKNKEDQDNIAKEVNIKYQEFFSTSKRDYFHHPKLIVHLQNFLIGNFGMSEDDLCKLYHPSMIDIYPSAEDQVYLKSPKTGAFKNPMAYKTLHKLRKVINYLIEQKYIDGDTRVVVEIARDLNDKNRRAAIEDYQRTRERENLMFAEAISELVKDPEFNGSASPDSKKDREKMRLWTDQLPNRDEVITKVMANKDDIMKYRLWKEQKCFCFYSGKPIRITDLFNDNIIDFEHTIPRSKSFDNSLANLTVCYADYNRNIKKNKIPTELPNFSEASHGYTAIEPRLNDWILKIDQLYNQIQTQVRNSKFAKDKDSKDLAIRRRHSLQMEYDYWKNKVDRFTREDIPSGFKNSQLIDTQIISKYAFHYLRTVFSHVETIKGSVTSEFRKIYGIQPKDETKDRSKHSHHAVDAAVLTLLPSSAKRKEILERSYEYEETNNGDQYHEQPFKGYSYSIIKKIENEILINNMTDQDRTLAPVKKYIRRRGRMVYLRNDKGEFVLDENGQKIPMRAQGDAVRGQLHKETFYGKNKIAAKDENGTLMRDADHNIIYALDNKGNEVYQMVGRKPIESVNFNTDIIVDEHLGEYLKSQIENGAKPNELLDYQGNVIRRLRCVVKSGRGVMNPENATKLKIQTYLSRKEYKNYYYTDSGDNYMFGLYENEHGRRIVSINTLESTRYALDQNEDTKQEIFKSLEPIMIGSGKNKKEGKLIHVFIPGQKVLFFFDNREELKYLNKWELSNRLYVIRRFHQADRGSMIFEHHIEARSDEELANEFGAIGKNGFAISALTDSFTPPRILYSPNKDVLIIEGKDFEMNLDATITFRF